MRVLVVNAGSSSLKLRLLSNDTLERSADITAGPDGFDAAELANVVRSWAVPDAVGHRIVHGGLMFRRPVIVTPEVRRQLETLIDLAPLHQPKSLAALDAVTAMLPNIVVVASFDTAFHSTLPKSAATYALPREWRDRYELRRYGFHGLSHAYSSHRAIELLDRPRHRAIELLDRPDEPLRVVTCHLGAGASLAAVVGGRSVDTTMGFTPLDGLVMATRSGSIDPGLVLWLEEHAKLTAAEIATGLETRSGMTGLAGTSDMRQVEAAAVSGDSDALLAIDVYIHSLAGGIAAMCASAGGLDALVFTGGVGENSEMVRRLTAARLKFLGIEIQDDQSVVLDREISSEDSRVRTFVVAAREDLQISRETRVLVGPSMGNGLL